MTYFKITYFKLGNYELVITLLLVFYLGSSHASDDVNGESVLYKYHTSTFPFPILILVEYVVLDCQCVEYIF